MKRARSQRYKVTCKVCERTFESDYRLAHNRKYHNEMVQAHKFIPYQRDGIPCNPFEAAKGKPADSKTHHDTDEAGVPDNKEETEKTKSKEPNKDATPQTIHSGDEFMSSFSSSEDDDDDGCISQTPVPEKIPSTSAVKSNIQSKCTESSDSSSQSSGDDTDEETDKDNDDMKNSNDEPIDWLTCVGHLADITEYLHKCQSMINNIQESDNPDVDTFLQQVMDITSTIGVKCKTLNQKTTHLLNELRDHDPVSDARNVDSAMPHRDPGITSPEQLNDAQRRFLIHCGPHQPALCTYPKNSDIPENKQNCFSKSWYSTYPHLEYSVVKDAAYCFVCRLFPSGVGREKSENAWCTGIRHWHKMKSRGTKKPGKLSAHFGSASHKAALSDFLQFKHPSAHIDVLIDKKLREQRIKEEKVHVKNEEVVSILLDVTRTLARQGLAFRGDESSDQNSGNFYQITQLLARHCPIMKHWLDQRDLRPYHTTYMSPESQNELIQLVAQDVKQKIVSEVSNAGIFAIMADTTPDMTHQDRLAVSIHYVSEEGSVNERLLSVTETKDKTGLGQANDILEAITNSELDTGNIVFQSYDFASNMSGPTNGAQAVMQKQLERRIPYIPCQAHRTNTVVQHACENSDIVMSMLNTLQDVYVFFTASTKRYSAYSQALKDVEHSLKLKQVSETRWTSRLDSVKALWSSYDIVTQTLHDIKTDTSTYYDKSTKAKAGGLLKSIEQIDFVVAIMFMKNILASTNSLVVHLQAPELNVMDALKLSQATVQSLQRSAQNDDELNAQIEASCEFVTERGIDPVQDFKHLHRPRRLPKKFNKDIILTARLPSAVESVELKQYYRKEFKCVFDSLISGFNQRLQPTLEILQPLASVLQCPDPSQITTEKVKAVTEFLPKNSEVDADLLKSELELFSKVIQNDNKDIEHNLGSLSTLAFANRDVLPLNWLAYKLIMTAPVSVAKDERTFSQLKLLKTFSRASMLDERLGQLLLLKCEKDLTDKVDLPKLAKQWSSLKRRR